MIAGNFSAVPGLALYRPGTGTAAGVNRTPFTGNVIPSSLINPTAAAIASFFPAPNLPGFSNNYISNVPFQNHGNKADGRIDHHFSDRTNLFLRYGFTNYWAAEASPLGNVIGAGTRIARSITTRLSASIHNFGPRVAMDLRMGYNRYDQRLNPLSDETALGAAFRSSNFGNNLAGINITGLAPIGAPAYVPDARGRQHVQLGLELEPAHVDAQHQVGRRYPAHPLRRVHRRDVEQSCSARTARRSSIRARRCRPTDRRFRSTARSRTPSPPSCWARRRRSASATS